MSETKQFNLKSRKKISRKSQIARKILQAISLAVFVVTLVFSKDSACLPCLQAAWYISSPLAMLSNLFSSKFFLSGSLLSLVILLSSLVVSRHGPAGFAQWEPYWIFLLFQNSEVANPPRKLFESLNTFADRHPGFSHPWQPDFVGF